MPPIGETLRQARMRHSLDIADVEARTKIRAKYLRALENEEFGVLPGSTTVRSFLRTYAEVLGLDPHLLVEEYRARHEEVEPELQPLAAAPNNERRLGGGGGPPGPGVVLLGAIVAVLAIFLVLGLTGGDEEGSGDRSAATETATTRTERARPRRPRPRPRPTAAAMRIDPAEPTYACVDTGPGTAIVFEGILDASRRFRARRLRLNLGKASAAVIANGRRVPLPDTPNPVGLDVTPTSVRPLAEGRRPCA